MPKAIEAPVKHTQECVRFMAIGKAKYTRFIHKYPNYCKACGGYGLVATTDYESMQPDVDYCEQCIIKDLCPRCMTPTMREVKEKIRYKGQVPNSHITCSVCRWLESERDRYCLSFEKGLNSCICKQFEK